MLVPGKGVTVMDQLETEPPPVSAAKPLVTEPVVAFVNQYATLVSRTIVGIGSGQYRRTGRSAH